MNSDFFRILASQAESAGLEFLVVGGNAVNAYGYQRTTLDIDLLIREKDLKKWRSFWEARGYRCIHSTEAFCQFRSASEEELFPVDLMIVAESTFEKITAKGRPKPMGGARLTVPDPLHLIALKLHALRNEARAAEGKDLLDIIGLIRACELNVESVEFQEILDRYATPPVQEQILHQVKGL